MDIVEVFKKSLLVAAEKSASDIHVSAGGPLRMRVGGEVIPVDDSPTLTPEHTEAIGREILINSRKANEKTVDEMIRILTELDCSYSYPGLGRFRVNLCSQRGSVAAVLRAIPDIIPTFETLGLPPVLNEIAMEDRGMILVTGTTGSGKTSTLAAMVGYVNERKARKIVTIEDPIEFLHRDLKSIVIQRELGNDTDGFEPALRAALRQDPDIIMIGEMRDRITIDIALKAAETGHLIFSTLHTTDAARAVTRLASVFEPNEQLSVRKRLSEVLKAVVSQRLLPRVGGPSRVLAVEVMRNTAAIEECIADPDKTMLMAEFIAQGGPAYGMRTFDQHLTELHASGLISREVAIAAAASPADFERNLQFQ
ncbi:MAG TPA: PilT/PilU family type 4a pilus ATPase [Gemmatimonadales bacterium]